jgi:hypothetical protein
MQRFKNPTRPMTIRQRSRHSARPLLARARTVGAVLSATTVGLLYVSAISPAASADTYIGSSLSEGGFMYGGD